jgi:hypothetical protein
MKILTINQFYNKLKKISSKNVIKQSFGDGENSCCVIGHAMRLSSDDSSNFSRSHCSDYDISKDSTSNLREISKKFLANKFPIHPEDDWNPLNIAKVNNQKIEAYRQKTPKARILACLKDMIDAGFGNELVR